MMHTHGRDQLVLSFHTIEVDRADLSRSEHTVYSRMFEICLLFSVISRSRIHAALDHCFATLGSQIVRAAPFNKPKGWT
ncbi:hypothetical protein DL93DRAFT_2090453 [Clavulina sp. PMI_390]|nr:hypothetical protein DL93DRAFT_2090453 [Clavulina sp. PMI_390]